MSDDLSERIKETRGLIRVRKARVAAQVNNGEDSPATTTELAAIHRLELQLANLEQIERANALTRHRK